MPTITGGKVVFSRTVQPADYESKKAEIELTFTVGEDEDHLEAAASVMVDAQNIVLVAVGKRSSDKRGK